MRSFILAFLSTLLISPISVLATYGEHGHHPDHPHQSDEVDHVVSKRSEKSTSNVPSIAVKMVYLQSDVNTICDREVDICLEMFECHENNESCERKNKCYEKKSQCFREYKCNKESKICQKKTTDRDGFRCGREFYTQAKILAAASAACDHIEKNSESGALFDKAGHYIEWPMTRTGRFFEKLIWSRRRLMITRDCAVVGAVYRHSSGDTTMCKYERKVPLTDVRFS